MHKRTHITIARVSMLIVVGLAVFTPMAHAQTTEILKMFGLNFANFFAEVFATLATAALYVMSWWVSITGALLNVSITLTLHIKDFVNSTPGVYIVWQTIRDISSIFIIFMLLYASFMLILDLPSKSTGSVGNLIKNIVIGGILINFSFFITSLLIDASNVVSLALYNGIVETPTTTTGTGQTVNGQAVNCPPSTGGLDTCTIAANTMVSTNKGDLGSIFMNLLKPQSIYDPKNTQLANSNQGQGTTPAPLQILIQGAVGCVIMFTMGMSFLLASLAFVARLAILVLLLGFSPVWFAAMIFPALKDKAKEFTDHLYGQLVFMPVYLLLLYGAMTVLTKTTVFSNPSGNVFTGTNGTFVPVNLIVLAINDFFILFLLNLPLATAFAFVTKDGAGMSWMKGMVDKANSKNVWKNVGSWSGRNSLGLTASKINESSAMRSFYTRNPNLGLKISQGLSKTSSLGFGGGKGAGYDDTRKKKIEEYKKFAERANYSAEEQDSIRENMLASDPEVTGWIRDKGVLETKNVGLGKERKTLSEQAGKLAERLKTATNPDDKRAIAAQLDAVKMQRDQVNEEMNETKEEIKNHENKINSKIEKSQNSPKEAVAQRFSNQKTIRRGALNVLTAGMAGKGSSKFYRDAARTIRKKKSQGDEIMDALKELKAKDSGGGEKKT
jgi:hypothetical protein